ncbi:hypothetical protein [Naasia sp. SYSU D00057]|uniref:hypothetical protein n=1 Tax=Naasia sp. SYSU D00057 TaxID=2817380 RepID=UPI001B30DBC7|nr:hypothetical protein [Naasia sp. SYSU D00057]
MSERPASAEPNALLPLRWSGYRTRQVLGLALIFAGAALLLPTTAYTMPVGLAGAAGHVTGWLILPAPGGRRLLAAVASVSALLLMTLLPQLAALMAVPLALWLLVRRRPGRVYPLALAPALAGVLVTQVAGPYAARLPVLAGTAAVAVAAAWAASALSVRSARPISANSLADR